MVANADCVNGRVKREDGAADRGLAPPTTTVAVLSACASKGEQVLEPCGELA